MKCRAHDFLNSPKKQAIATRLGVGYGFLMNSEIQSDSQSVYPAIYDFSVLPYALGDILTWNVKACVKAEQAGKKEVDVYLCADQQKPFCFVQRDQIDQSNYQSYFFELFQVFFCNPMLRNLHVYSDRPSFGHAVARIPKDHKIVEVAIAEYEDALLKAEYRHATPFLTGQCSSYADMSAFHAAKGRIPKLITPKGCRGDVMKFRNAIGRDQCVITLNFRTRDQNPSIPNVDPQRNASASTWYDFLKLVGRKFPNVTFLLLGKIEDNPPMLMQLNNVVTPRLCGLHLGHELGLIEVCDFFMGSCSGFAMMATLCDTPYVITKIMENTRSVFGITPDKNRLSFAGEDQLLVHEEESVQTLFSHFGRMHTQWKKKMDSQPPASLLPEEWKEFQKWKETHQEQLQMRRVLFRPPEALENNMRHYTWEKSLQAQKMMEAGNPAGAMALLDRLIQEYPEAVGKQQNFQSLRAMVLIRMQKLREAKDALDEELARHPFNHEARDMKKGLELSMRQHGLI